MTSPTAGAPGYMNAPATALSYPGGPASGECLHCGLDAPPLTTSVSRATDP